MTDYTLPDRDLRAPSMTTVEASTIGLPVGEWPATIYVEGYKYVRGRMNIDPDGDVRDVRYAEDRCRAWVLIVVND